MISNSGGSLYLRNCLKNNVSFGVVAYKTDDKNAMLVIALDHKRQSSVARIRLIQEQTFY